MKIKKLTIQGFHKVDKKVYEFDKLNYLKGANGSGKSTVLQAIQLALLGYIPETKKTNDAIMSHSNGNFLSVTLELEDNGVPVTVERSWARMSKINSSVKITPEGYDIEAIYEDLELPIFNFHEFIGLTANKLKDWFIEFLPDSKIEVDWENVLSEELTAAGIVPINSTIIQDTIDQISYSSYGQGLEQIRRVNEYFKACVSACKQQVARNQNTVQSLVHYEDFVEDMTLEEASAKITDLQQKQIEIKTAQSRNAEIQRIQSALSAYDEYAENIEDNPEYIDAVSTVMNNEAEKNVWLQKKSAISEKSSTLLADVNMYHQFLTSMKDGAVCPFLNKPCADLSSKIDEYTSKYEESKKLYDQSQQDMMDVAAAIQECDKLIQVAQAEINRLNHIYRDRDALRLSLGDVVEVPDISLDEIEEQLADLQEYIVKYKTNQNYSNLIDTCTRAVMESEQTLQIYKLWEKLTSVNGLQSQSGAESPFTVFANEISSYVTVLFNENTHAHFKVDQHANSFSFGVMRNDQYIPYDLLSSGEKCMYTLALMLCIINQSASPLKLVMVDDMFDHLDGHNMENLFKTLKSVPDIQMVFAGVADVNDSNINIMEVK